MAYIGNTVQNQGFTPAIDYFSGNGVTVTFTLSRPVVSVAQMIVAVDNVIQNPSSAYTVSGSSITFTSAPLSGTNNIWVEYTSLITTYAAISQDPSVIGDITASGGYLSTGDFGNSYIDGTIVDYVTGNARITTGPADGLTIYNGGTSARTALAAWGTTGHLTNTGAVASNGGPVSGNSLVAGRVDTGSEGGQLDLCRSTDNVSAWAIDVYGNTSTPALRFIDNIAAAVRMQIDSSGRVTMPSQISCSIYLGSNQVGVPGTSGYQIPYNTVNHNIGSAFNTSTYRFTAPISGRYLINAQAYRASSASNTNYWGILIRINGSTIIGQSYMYGTGSDLVAVNSGIYQLTAGDYITVTTDNNSTTYTLIGGSTSNATVFCAQLLS